MNKRRFVLLCGAVALAATPSTAVQARDVAIVIGVGHYVNLPGSDLPGIDNDVQMMEGALSRAGFSIIHLFNETATYGGIRSAIGQASKQVGAGDRFVYYQSSHGSEDHHILTYNTTTSGENAIGSPEIQQWMASIPTNRKSLLLDACFSGGFKGRSIVGINKFYPLRKFKERTAEIIRNQDAPTAFESSAPEKNYPVFASSQQDQESLVVSIGGQQCSVFTYFLADYLNKSDAKQHWNAIVQPTVSGVKDATSGKQTPVFNDRYLDALLYSTSNDGGGTGTIPIGDFSQLYNIENHVADTLTLEVKMSQDSDYNNAFKAGTTGEFKVAVNKPGYLFIINRDNEGMAQMVGWGREDLDYSDPEKMLQQSYIDEAQSFTVGKGTLTIKVSHRTGVEYWKAFLFPDQDTARVFASAWTKLATDKKKAVRSGSFGTVKLADLERFSPQAVYTSELSYKVTE